MRREAGEVAPPELCDPWGGDYLQQRHTDRAAVQRAAAERGGARSSGHTKFCRGILRSDYFVWNILRVFFRAKGFILRIGKVTSMPRTGTAARRRAREGREPVKPGKISWVHGSKLPFFQAHREAYLTAAEMKETGGFYEKLVHLYLAKYGYNTDWEGDLDDGLTVAADVDPDEDVDTLSPEKSATRAEYFKKLKGPVETAGGGLHVEAVNERRKLDWERE
ncbi:hypothetical protein B0H14DRAFT_2646078 [Mycena olivaceomarginata]|nr:hypothetical protein B0H14DRAFT_2646078 [Mycena olivaceomarginata]